MEVANTGSRGALLFGGLSKLHSPSDGEDSAVRLSPHNPLKVGAFLSADMVLPWSVSNGLAEPIDPIGLA